MIDMNPVIQPKSDQINADDLIAGPMTVTIESVSIESRNDQPISIALVGMKKVYRPCKSMAKVMVHAWGADASKYAGRSLTLYRDPKVKWAGLEVGGIRISHMTDIDALITMMLTQTQKQRAPYKVQPLKVQQTPVPQNKTENALDICEAVAKQGTEALRAWWNGTEYKTVRETAQANKDRLIDMAKQADFDNQPAEPAAPDEDEPLEEGPPM